MEADLHGSEAALGGSHVGDDGLESFGHDGECVYERERDGREGWCGGVVVVMVERARKKRGIN